jgi:hypothetical protein
VDGANRVRAEVVLLAGDAVVALGDIRRSVRCDLSLVDALARMQLAAKRLGWRIEVVDADEELAGFLALVGLSDVLGA